ncbi:MULTISPECIES: hypothetical protein [Leeuwenhoekiella]|jgi:hypothetical protein|uniref:hypothetical protein n=1 Tax=Leeuwenhoekiella TaxID=283735 RepID=UPI000C4A4044|nr:MULTISPECIES: hypothetical protein [Leeuwenhoekiella]MAO41914.1 hypothetical protein [Leeuwenhoekiella sp.]HBT08896.1 hypothetical protein [Leeuwenhoekiella sp.]HCW65324.1 hypothetical protein [Leeuwenhoekiella sp.]|tara:strand:+ start:3352 stop:4194 length:843 start_codon:yes stop_codon:yes gene_type:complete
MNALLILGIGLEYVDTIFETIQNSPFSQFTITGIKTLAVLFFLINILKQYNEGIADKEGYTWGLRPQELAKNFAIVLLVIFSTQILGFFDSILLAVESQYRDTAPALLPLQMQDIPIEEEVGMLEATKAAMSLLYEALVTPLFGFKIFAFIGSIILWILDLFIYPLFLAERFFLLGIMQAFFPLVLSLSVFEKFRSLAYGFFKLYAAVYMLVPAFFLVNIFINAIYTEINENFWEQLFGTDYMEGFFAPVVQFGSVGFIVFLKFKLYRRATSFTLRLFTQ